MSVDTDHAAGQIAEVVAIAKVAGKKILELYESDVAVTSKEDDTPLTEADLAGLSQVLFNANRVDVWWDGNLITLIRPWRTY